MSAAIPPFERPPASPEKRLATLTAVLALAGHAVHKTREGYLVTRWGMSRHCWDLDALEAFARQIGALK